jgi:hypothetical protein
MGAINRLFAIWFLFSASPKKGVKPVAPQWPTRPDSSLEEFCPAPVQKSLAGTQLQSHPRCFSFIQGIRLFF